MESEYRHHKENRKMDHHRNHEDHAKRRVLKPGVEYIDRKLGVGIVRKVSDDGVTVSFGDMEKVFPRKTKRTYHEHASVFTFAPRTTRRRRVRVDDPVYSKELGKGIVSRISERGTYVTFEKTGESVLFPTGIPNSMLYRESKENKKQDGSKKPKGKGRTYVVEEKPVVKKEKTVPSHPAKVTNHGHVNYIEISAGTEVVAPENGAGVIERIDDGKLYVTFQEGTEAAYKYPECFENGNIEVVEPDKNKK